MDNATFIGMLILALVTLIGLLTAIITPILKLNSSIIRLNSSIEMLFKYKEEMDGDIKLNKDGIDSLKERVSENEHRITNHETRLLSIEKNREKKGCF